MRKIFSLIALFPFCAWAQIQALSKQQEELSSDIAIAFVIAERCPNVTVDQNVFNDLLIESGISAEDLQPGTAFHESLIQNHQEASSLLESHGGLCLLGDLMFGPGGNILPNLLTSV